MSENKNFVLFGLILGISLIASACIGAYMYHSAQLSGNVLSVTGSAKVSVTSDTVKWTSTISRTVKIDGLKAGYTDLAKDLVVVTDFMHAQGITDDQMTISPVQMNQDYSNQTGPHDYTLQQNIDIQSTDVTKITAIAKNVQTIIDKGVIFSSYGLQYYYSKLPEVRVSLLGDAIADAKSRAEKIAASAGGTIGVLRGASSGVVQVVSSNATDVSDYGTYDTSAIQKDIMVTVKASFGMK